MSSEGAEEEEWDRHEMERDQVGGDSGSSTGSDEGLIYGRGEREGSGGRV